MVSKNSEVLLVVIFGVFIENNCEGNIDMNSVQNKELSFYNVILVLVFVVDGIWLILVDIVKVLGYVFSKSVLIIYLCNLDEFISSMLMVIKMKINGINNNLCEKLVCVFFFCGCYLIVMFVIIDKVKEFCCWVLDILDWEVVYLLIVKQFSDEEFCLLFYLWRLSVVMYEVCYNIYLLLLVVEYKLLFCFVLIVINYVRIINRM